MFLQEISDNQAEKAPILWVESNGISAFFLHPLPGELYEAVAIVGHRERIEGGIQFKVSWADSWIATKNFPKARKWKKSIVPTNFVSSINQYFVKSTIRVHGKGSKKRLLVAWADSLVDEEEILKLMDGQMHPIEIEYRKENDLPTGRTSS